jgi:hypothetical protein
MSAPASLFSGGARNTAGFLAPGMIFFCDVHFTVLLIRLVPLLEEKSHLALKCENMLSISR